MRFVLLKKDSNYGNEREMRGILLRIKDWSDV